jgi:hypothetical protein
MRLSISRIPELPGTAGWALFHCKVEGDGIEGETPSSEWA